MNEQYKLSKLAEDERKKEGAVKVTLVTSNLFIPIVIAVSTPAIQVPDSNQAKRLVIGISFVFLVKLLMMLSRLVQYLATCFLHGSDLPRSRWTRLWEQQDNPVSAT